MGTIIETETDVSVGVRLIPIGCQCTVERALSAAHLKQCSYPFDSILSYPEEIHRLLSIVIDGVDANTLVGKEFFTNVHTSSLHATKYFEHYIIDSEGGALTDLTHMVTFPHHQNTSDTYNIFARRFARLQRHLKEAQTTDGTPILLIYCDPGGPNCHYSVNLNEDLTRESLRWLVKISQMMNNKGIKHNILYFTYDTYLATQMYDMRFIDVIYFPAGPHWLSAYNSVLRFMNQYMRDYLSKKFIGCNVVIEANDYSNFKRLFLRS